MERNRKGFELHLHISSLFIVLILTCGLSLVSYSDMQINKLMLDASEQLFERIDKEIETSVDKNYYALETTLTLLAKGNLGQGRDIEARHKTFAQLWQILQVNPDMNAVYAGYQNGDFYFLSKLHPDQLEGLPESAQSAKMLLTTIEHGTTANQAKLQVWHQYYDDSGEFIYGNDNLGFDYDPRLRAWYQQAMADNKLIVTQPYIFRSSQLPGITLAVPTEQKQAVVAVDFTLASLSSTLTNQDLPDASQALILDAKGQVIAYQDANKLFSKQGSKLMPVGELGQPVLDYVVANYEIKPQKIDFEYAQDHWLGELSKLRFSHQGDYYLLMITPTKALLKNAQHIRNTSLYIALIIISITLPIAWLFSRLVAKPIKDLTLQLKNIKNFDFSQPIKSGSVIREVAELANVASSMQQTIANFQHLSKTLSAHQSLPELLKSMLQQSALMTKTRGGVVYLYDKASESYQYGQASLLDCQYEQAQLIVSACQQQADRLLQESGLLSESEKVKVANYSKSQNPLKLEDLLCHEMACEQLRVTWIKLTSQHNEPLGILAMLEPAIDENYHEPSFIQALGDYCGLAIEGQLLLNEQQQLLEGFIELIASAIDSKSPYTGGHCSRVPEITKLLAKAACYEREGCYADFTLSREQWQELHIAAWLHDCGKITTPEFVVDKATKLETIYNRVHEIRMRFELLKMSAQRDYWQGLAQGQNENVLRQQRDNLLQQLDSEFDFVAKANIGGESMLAEDIARLQQIAKRTWQRTLNDRIGLSRDELARMDQTAPTLPVTESLLADKAEHLIAHDGSDLAKPGNPWGFNMAVPNHKYNRGELHNLSIERGTLTAEDRYIINSHIIYTDAMLSKLPFPKDLKKVPIIAASHHERMDGQGYPKKVAAGTLPLTARMMMIADVFEALTASDRPYKEAKTLSEAIKIMSFMVKEQHLDGDLFALFLRSGVYLDYAKKYLQPEQMDQVDLSVYGIISQQSRYRFHDDDILAVQS
ncbi:HD domain-containing phosphohydrolase [Motilimonas sp. KMU-193]|uniref:HD domain-containing phosphohydrolase n=1 Tax=Motilimonas sp. KMU-193 TaxID=3388668 RepID=UPI00396AF0DB